MKWCNLLNMWRDDIDDDVANFCDGDCNCCDETKEVKGDAECFTRRIAIAEVE